jgi:predicted ATPase/class 3 adenylate cyclase
MAGLPRPPTPGAPAPASPTFGTGDTVAVDERAGSVPSPSPAGPTAPPLSQLLGATLGHFRLDELLGHGGMGVVYRALDMHLQRTVALKVMRPELSANEERRRLFLGEARAAAAISHPNVAAVYYVGIDGRGPPTGSAAEWRRGSSDEGQIYIAMELAEGKTLRSRLSAGLSLDEALAVATQITRGMARAHDKGVLHRDLKPENVMVGADGEVKILDFGVARRLLAEDDVSAQYRIVGTTGYMSPEQIEGREVDNRTDIFAFGVVLHELVTGNRPLADDDLRAPSALVSPELDAIIRRCLARRREDRYPDMRALGVALEGLRADRGERVGAAAALPSGAVTLLAAAGADTMRLLEELGDRYAGVLARRDEVLRQAIERHGGVVVEATSEGIVFVLVDARAALRAALDAQHALAAEPWPHEVAGRVRMGLHTGEPRRAGHRYVGLDMHRAARITAAAAAGQLLISAATRALLDDGDLAGLEVRDLGARRLADLRFPEHLFAIGLPGSAAARAASTMLGAVRHNVPELPTTFVGREAQVAEVRQLLARPGTRVVTLTGPGGIGKTRLSLEVVRAVLGEFPAGVLQVALAPVSDPALVMATIAQVLDVPLAAGRPALDTVKLRIGGERMLLVLDNFEQVIDATRTLAELLAGCPELKLLVTSRQALKLRGEREHVVPPMQVPVADGRGGGLAACESVRLFVDRVRDTHADFALTADNGPIVAAICARLEGLPLAIELAASRMKMLTLPALRDRLGDRLGVLKGGSRDAETRHQTLRAAIDWSYDLLDEPDRMLFRRAAVFVGGFAIESAEAVCELPASTALDVFSGLASLTDKSLLTRGDVDGEPRLGMLETIREYALDQLGRSGDLAIARARHAAHFVALAETMAPGLMDRDQRRAVGRMLTEADNLRAAFGWALEQPTADATARLLRALQWLWIPQGQFNEGRAWAARAVLQARRHGAPRPLAEVLDVTAWLGFLSGDLAGAVPLGQEAVALFDALGDEAAAARAKIALGASSLMTAPIAECERLLDEALVVCRRHSDLFGAAMALNALGELARAREDAARARACYAEAIVLLQQCDNIFMSSLISSNLVVYHMRDGDWHTAAGLLGKMVAVGQEFNYPMLVYFALAAMGGVAVARGRADDGVRLIAAAERMLSSIGHAPEPADRAEWDRHIAAARAGVGDDAVAAALAEGATWTREQALAAAAPLWA